jgi:hypothetical protein
VIKVFGFMVNQRNEHALEMLRQAHVNFDTAVWTADGHLLGYVLRFHHRQDEVNPLQKLYGTYIEVSRLEMGNSAFIPVDFAASFDAGKNRIILSVTYKTVENETWERTPDFVARGLDKKEELSV